VADTINKQLLDLTNRVSTLERSSKNTTASVSLSDSDISEHGPAITAAVSGDLRGVNSITSNGNMNLVTPGGQLLVNGTPIGSGGGGGAVSSVNGQTGDVVLTQDDVADGTTYKQYSATDKTKLAGIESGADVTDATNVAAAGAIMDADFTANGLMIRTASGTYLSRTLTGTANQITVTNGDGVSGNPTLSLPAIINVDTTGSAAKLTTARTIRTNLASTSTASFDGTANITPGVTGTLPIANGGTGATTAAGILTAAGLTATAAEINVLHSSGATNADLVALHDRGSANGVATLDAGGKVPVAQLPNSVMEYQGTWNASTNTPTLADGTGSPGDVYRVSVAGTQNLGSGSLIFTVGDYAIYNTAGVWEKADTTDAVSSVNGKIGVVVLTASDIGFTALDGTITATDTQTAISQVYNSRADKNRTISAGTGLTGGGDLTANRTISMPNVGTAGTYGSATSVPVFTTDAQGRITTVTGTTITGLPQSSITGLTTQLPASTTTAGQYLRSTGTAATAAWTTPGNIQANLASTTAANPLAGNIGVTGVLPVANGGTGVATIAGTGTAGKVLASTTSATAAAPSWRQLNAVEIINTPAGGVTSTDLQAAINELDAKKTSAGTMTFIEVSSSTAAGTAAKVGTTTGGSYVPAVGDIVHVTLTNSNSASSPTLAIDGGTARAIYLGSSAATNTESQGTSWFIRFNGTQWELFGALNNSTYSEISDANLQNATSSAVGTITGRRMEAEQAYEASVARTLTNKSIDGADNTLTNIPGYSIVGSIGVDTTGNAATATKLASARTISLTGDVSGSTSFDGSANVSITATVADNSHNHILANITDVTATAAEVNVLDGITASTTELNYTDGVTSNIQTQLNAKSADSTVVHLTGNETIAGTKTFSSTISGSVSGNAGTATKLATARTIQTNLSSTSSASFDGSANVSPGIKGTLPVSYGGTGATTQNEAAHAIGADLPGYLVSTIPSPGGTSGQWAKIATITRASNGSNTNYEMRLTFVITNENAVRSGIYEFDVNIRGGSTATSWISSASIVPVSAPGPASASTLTLIVDDDANSTGTSGAFGASLWWHLPYTYVGWKVYTSSVNSAGAPYVVSWISSAVLAGTTDPVAGIGGLSYGSLRPQYNQKNFLLSDDALDAANLTGTASVSTTGSAATLTTARTILTNLGSTTAASFNGSANVTPGISGTLTVNHGGTGATTLASGNVLVGNGTSAITATKAAPSGAFVGTTDTQTLTNKTIQKSDGNILSGYTGSILLDSSVPLTKLVAAGLDNLIANPGAELDAIDPSTGTASRIYPNYAAGTISAVTTEHRGGSYAYRVTESTTAGTVLLSYNGNPTNTDIHPISGVGDEFYGEAYIKAVSGTQGSLSLRIAVYNASGSLVQSDITSVEPRTPDTSGYSPITVSGAVTASDAAYIVLQVIQSTASGSGAIFSIDDAYLRRKVSGETIINGSLSVTKLQAGDIITDAEHGTTTSPIFQTTSEVDAGVHIDSYAITSYDQDGNTLLSVDNVSGNMIIADGALNGSAIDLSDSSFITNLSDAIGNNTELWTNFYAGAAETLIDTQIDDLVDSHITPIETTLSELATEISNATGTTGDSGVAITNAVEFHSGLTNDYGVLTYQNGVQVRDGSNNPIFWVEPSSTTGDVRPAMNNAHVRSKLRIGDHEFTYSNGHLTVNYLG